MAKKLNIRVTQDILAKAWKPYMENPNIVLEDATCYESYMRYPTNVKLLWESVDWMYGQMKMTCKYLKIPTPRTKYLKQKEKYFTYMRNAQEAMEADNRTDQELTVPAEQTY